MAKKQNNAKDDWERMSKLTAAEREAEYLGRADKIWEKTWQMAHETEGWKKEGGTDPQTGQVSSKKYPEIGKVFRLEALVDAPAIDVFNLLVMESNTTQEWNPTILEQKVIQVLNDSTDIVYSVTAPAAGGLVSSRDFVNLRHWGTKDGTTISAAAATSHPDRPLVKQHVRAESRPGGWVFKPAQGDPNKCDFMWITNTDLKGWLPQSVVDLAFSGSMLDYLKHMRTKLGK